MDSQSSANYEGFSLVRGGLIYSLTSIFRGKSRDGRGLRRTALALVLISWVPLLVMAIQSGTMQSRDGSAGFLLDLPLHARFLIAVPFLILIERAVDWAFLRYVQRSDDLIPAEQQESFNRLVRLLDKLTDSKLPEGLLLVLIYGLTVLNWESLAAESAGRLSFMNSDGVTLRPAGWYFLLISAPVFQLLVFRWAWRWMVWAFSIFRISRFEIKVDPLHADRMAGLAYMNLCPLTFSFILMAPTAVVSATLGYQILFMGASFSDYIIPIFVYVFSFSIILYLPLIAFLPLLIRAKAEGIGTFGTLLRAHNLAYVKKWIASPPPADEHLLGSVDNSSLSDINGSYAPLHEMMPFPFDVRMFGVSVVLALLPFLPLVFAEYSATEVLTALIDSLLGG
jgi:hypothetical protein